MQPQITSSVAPAPAPTVSSTDKRQHWPELLRDAPRPDDPFPWRVILPWISGSTALLVLLLAMWGYLTWRAGHQILFLNRAGELIAMHADGSSARPVMFTTLADAQFGPPQWAHSGRRFAALTVHNGVDNVVVAELGSATPVLMQNSAGQLQSLPMAAWAPDDTRLAAIGTPNAQGNSTLFLADPAQSQITVADAMLFPETPLGWHPRESRLLITSPTSTFTPTLRIVGPDGTSTEFAPQDNQIARSFGAWSPDGTHIAYVATRDVRDNSLRGGIWVANADGSGPQQIIKDGLNLAPQWSPTGDAIFFTRWLTQTDSYDLYRVTAEGSNVTRIGAGTPAAATVGQSLLEWSPDRSKLMFQSLNRSTGATTIWVANGDGSNPQQVLTKPAAQGYLPARWAPTGRALLLVIPEDNIVLHWIDAQRSETRLAVGNAPNWQP